MILFMISFPVAIVKGDCQLIHSIEGGGFSLFCQGRAEQERSGLEWKGFTPEWKGFDNKSGGTTLASARALCLDRLSRVWLRISGGLNCCQESRRGVV